jgi:hypothetical protein
LSAIPVQEEGRSYVVTNVDRGAVDAAASGTRMRDQGEMNLVRSFCVRTNGAKAYGKIVWSWPSLLRSSLAEMDRGSTGSRGIANSQGDGDKRELVAGESAA